MRSLEEMGANQRKAFVASLLIVPPRLPIAQRCLLWAVRINFALFFIVAFLVHTEWYGHGSARTCVRRGHGFGRDRGNMSHLVSSRHIHPPPPLFSFRHRHFVANGLWLATGPLVTLIASEAVFSLGPSGRPPVSTGEENTIVRGTRTHVRVSRWLAGFASLLVVASLVVQVRLCVCVCVCVCVCAVLCLCSFFVVSMTGCVLAALSLCPPPFLPPFIFSGDKLSGLGARPVGSQRMAGAPTCGSCCVNRHSTPRCLPFCRFHNPVSFPITPHRRSVLTFFRRCWPFWLSSRRFVRALSTATACDGRSEVQALLAWLVNGCVHNSA